MPTGSRWAPHCSRWRFPMKIAETVSFISALTVVGSLAFTSVGEAQVVRLEIMSREAAGSFEILHGRVHGEVDPRLPQNRIIQDLELAPRNARGNVEYVATFAL